MGSSRHSVTVVAALLAGAWVTAPAAAWLEGGFCFPGDPCVVPCDGVAEQEPCGEDTNGGCVVDPPRFEPVAPGSVVCGTLWNDLRALTWDADWYLVHVDDPDGDGQATLCASLQADAISCCMIVDISDCAGPFPLGQVGPSAACVACLPATACVTAPGDYAVRVVPVGCSDGFPDIPCGSGQNEYRLCIDVIDACGAPCAGCPRAACPWDLDGGGTVGIADLLLLLAAWGSDPGGPPDFDGSGLVGIEDLLELLARWGRCR